MLSPEVVAEFMGAVNLLKFPPPASAGPKLVERIVNMCSTDEQVRWLANRVTELYDEWPGPHELRAVVCSRFKPKDGIEADSKHPRYVDDGIPKDPRLPAPPQVMIAAPNEAMPDDPEGKDLVIQTSSSKAMRRPTATELEASRRFFEERGVIGL